MPIPTQITDLSEIASSNSPAGSETVGTQANEYFQAAFAFIRQIYDGQINPTASVPLNGQKLTGLAKGTLSTTSTDAVRGDQLYMIGEVRMWHGAVANISTTWGAGWQLADGTNGTADLRNRFIVGAGSTYAVNATGGNSTNTISTAQLPPHNHGIIDNGHAHGVNDPNHVHGISDPQHYHGSPVASFVSSSGGAGGFIGGGAAGTVSATAYAATGIQVQAGSTGISIQLAGTNISVSNTGSGAALENKPPYYALCYIEYVGA